MRLSLETLTSIITTGSPIQVEMIDLVKSVTIFLSQMTLLRWLTFQLGHLTVTLTVLLFWIYFLLTLGSVLESHHIVVSVSMDFSINSKWDAPFHHIAYNYSCAAWDGLHDHLRDVP